MKFKFLTVRFGSNKFRGTPSVTNFRMIHLRRVPLQLTGFTLSIPCFPCPASLLFLRSTMNRLLNREVIESIIDLVTRRLRNSNVIRGFNSPQVSQQQQALTPSPEILDSVNSDGLLDTPEKNVIRRSESLSSQHSQHSQHSQVQDSQEQDYLQEQDSQVQDSQVQDSQE